MRWLGVTVLAVGALVLVPAIATATPARDAVVRPGIGIGKVELGMTLPQVRSALGGPPFTADRRINLGAGGRYIEYTWEVGSLDVRTWRVGLRSTTRNGPPRVVRVSTTVSNQKTREGLGVGSRPRDIVRSFSGASCELRSDREKGWYGIWIVVQQPNRGMLAFNLLVEDDPQGGVAAKVLEVLVQRSWLNDDPGEPREECFPNWRNS